ncbi:hypothetical protein R6Q59_029989 [Mikania micrantha]
MVIEITSEGGNGGASAMVVVPSTGEDYIGVGASQIPLSSYVTPNPPSPPPPPPPQPSPEFPTAAAAAAATVISVTYWQSKFPISFEFGSPIATGTESTIFFIV